MKIEWLNDDMTQCLVTKGWFKKRQALITRDKRTEKWQHIDGEDYWDSWRGNPVEYTREELLKVRANAARWQPVTNLPKAKVVK